MNTGAQAIFLSTRAGQGPHPTHRTDHTGHSGSGILALGFCAHTCNKGTNKFMKQKGKVNLVILGTSKVQDWGDWSKGDLKRMGQPRLLKGVGVNTQFKRAAEPKEKYKEVRKQRLDAGDHQQKGLHLVHGAMRRSPQPRPMKAKVSWGAAVFNQVGHKCLKLTSLRRTLV